MLYPALFRHAWLRRARAPRPRLFWLAAVLVGLLLAYVAVALVFAAWGADRLLALAQPGLDPLGWLNARLAPLLLGLLALRFLLQKPVQGRLAPYLALPVRRGALARFFTLHQVLSLHNALPLLFAVPFALRWVLPAGGRAGALCWLGGVVAVLLASDFLNTGARMLLGRRPLAFVGLAAGAALLPLLDEMAGTGWGRLAGWTLFSRLAWGDGGALATLWLGAGALFGLVSALLARQMRGAGAAPATAYSALRFSPHTPVRNLLYLETALVLRNARPRQFVLVSLLFSALYLVVFLARGGGETTALLLAYMATGMFALNYGPLMFGWESSFFDGLLARPHHFADVVRSKLVLLQASCVLLGGLALPLFLWLAPRYVLHLGATALYTAGIAVPAMLRLATRNQTRLDLSDGSLFNFQGVSARHMVWTAGLALPPVALVWVAGAMGLVVLAGLSLAGAVAVLAWPALFASTLHRRRYAMAAHFREALV